MSDQASANYGRRTSGISGPWARVARPRPLSLGVRRTGGTNPPAHAESQASPRRYAEGQFGRLDALAEELVRLPLDVLVAHGDAGVHARRATGTIPIVVVANPDPVGMGIAASLGRPGWNVTGLSDLHSDLVAKRLALLKEAIPSASRIGVLLRSGLPAHRPQLSDIQAARS